MSERFGFQCPECGKGEVEETVVKNFPTKYMNKPFKVAKAIIGICNQCGAKVFDPTERRKWILQFKKEIRKARKGK